MEMKELLQIVGEVDIISAVLGNTLQLLQAKDSILMTFNRNFINVCQFYLPVGVFYYSIFKNQSGK